MRQYLLTICSKTLSVVSQSQISAAKINCQYSFMSSFSFSEESRGLSALIQLDCKCKGDKHREFNSLCVKKKCCLHVELECCPNLKLDSRSSPIGRLSDPVGKRILWAEAPSCIRTSKGKHLSESLISGRVNRYLLVKLCTQRATNCISS